MISYKRADELIGKTFLVISIDNKTKDEAKESNRYCYEIGTIDYNDEEADEKHFDFLITYKMNGRFVHGDAIIGFVTKSENPEYFL